MNARPALFLTAALLAVSPAVADEEVDIQPHRLPAAVQRTLHEARGGDPVKKITRHTADDQTVYVVELERNNAINPRIRIAENGDLLSAPTPTGPEAMAIGDGAVLGLNPAAAAPTSQAYDARPVFSDLPEQVQETVRREARGREIADIDRETWNGRAIYEVEFRAEGLNPQIHVAADGTLVRDEKPRSGFDFFPGTQLSDTPPAVQETIRREAAGRPIYDIDVKRENGSTTYQVEIRDPRTGAYQLLVSQNGELLSGSRPSAPQPYR